MGEGSNREGGGGEEKKVEKERETKTGQAGSLGHTCSRKIG